VFTFRTLLIALILLLIASDARLGPGAQGLHPTARGTPVASGPRVSPHRPPHASDPGLVAVATDSGACEESGGDDEGGPSSWQAVAWAGPGRADLAPVGRVAETCDTLNSGRRLILCHLRC
jgi:hypothetical protein